MAERIRPRNRPVRVVVALAVPLGLCLSAAPAQAVLPQQTGNVDLLTQANIKLDGAAAYDHAASPVASAGDVNRDGYDDLIVAAPFGDSKGANSNTGIAYVVFGQPLLSYVDLASIGQSGNTDGFRIDGAAAGDRAGSSVDGAGDVNGDGLGDVIVGAPFADTKGLNSDSGAAYVIFGKTSYDTVDLAQIGAAGNTQGFRLDGAAAGDQAGNAVAGAGDESLDGLADIVVGAHYAHSGQVAIGSAYVVFGRTSPATVDLASIGQLGDTNGFRIIGESYTDAGQSVAGAGDVNADGRPDSIVGADNTQHNNRSESGSAYVVFGRATFTTVSLGALGNGGFRIDGGAARDWAGYSVSGAQLVNDDQLTDVVVGAPVADTKGYGSNTGAAYVIFGKSNDTLPIDLYNVGRAGNTDGFRIDGAAGGDSAGWSVGAAGDGNGDGRPDVIVGAPYAYPISGRYQSGAAYVIFGKPSYATVDLAKVGQPGNTDGIRAAGAVDYGQAGSAVAGSGDLNGDQRPDALIGAPNVTGAHTRYQSGVGYAIYGFGTPEVIYNPSSIVATRDSPVDPLAPSVKRTGTASFTVSPALPAGLGLDPATGTISGTPTVAQSGRVYVVTMTDLAGSASTPLAIKVELPPRDIRYIDEFEGG